MNYMQTPGDSEDSRDWYAVGQGVAKSWTQLVTEQNQQMSATNNSPFKQREIMSTPKCETVDSKYHFPVKETRAPWRHDEL